MQLIDSHCHLDDYEDLPEVIARANAAGVTRLLAIGIGNGPDDMHRALEIARAHENIFATAGIHPQEAHRADGTALRKLEELAADPKCIAIGEIGLDYYHLDNPDPAIQQEAFLSQMEIAAAARKPITIHCRTSELATPQAKQKFEQAGNPHLAFDDLIYLIQKHWVPTGLPGIMHCFSGNAVQAAQSLAAGFYLSFAGNLTYPKSVAIQDVAKTAPADRILVETDAPFLTPIPLRGQRNEPAHTSLTARFLADLRGVSADEIAAQTTANFERLFPTTAQAEHNVSE
ncbi:TatD family hydrolase [Bryocella elongata]|nr:TatD family hydrolase [Bryocella elongata]